MPRMIVLLLMIAAAQTAPAPVIDIQQGKKLFEGKVKPSADAVLESWRAREDRELLYRASVTVAVP